MAAIQQWLHSAPRQNLKHLDKPCLIPLEGELNREFPWFLIQFFFLRIYEVYFWLHPLIGACRALPGWEMHAQLLCQSISSFRNLEIDNAPLLPLLWFLCCCCCCCCCCCHCCWVLEVAPKRRTKCLTIFCMANHASAEEGSARMIYGCLVIKASVDVAAPPEQQHIS